VSGILDKATLLESERCLKGLNRALTQASGCAMTFERLDEMTALEFLMVIAPNDIQFVHVPKNRDRKENGK
jgi:hypothetical protein